MDDYYKILQVEKTASADEIKRSYRRLAKKFHPDQAPDNKDAHAIFVRLNEAYQVLSDSKKKEDYDRRFFGTSQEAFSRRQDTAAGSTNNAEKQRTKTTVNFDSTDRIFENFFGFNPNTSDKTVHFKDETIKPVKTKDAFEKIFGKRHFR